jgi:type II secretory pathway pseudopilin PulG
MSCRSRGFTLIEILVACILLGVGVTSVIGVLLTALQRSREVTAMTTMGPVATAAATLCAVHNLVPATGDVLDLPPDDPATAPFSFESPYALRIDRAPDLAHNDPTSAAYDPGSPLADTSCNVCNLDRMSPIHHGLAACKAGTDEYVLNPSIDNLVTLRVRVYDNPDHRALGVRPLGTMFIRQYLRPRPAP